MKSKDDVARELAEAHWQIEPGIAQIFRIVATNDDLPTEPIKLLEVNPDTPSSGIVPVAFGPGGNIPYPSVVIEITPEEFEKLKNGQLQLPKEDWGLGEQLYKAS